MKFLAQTLILILAINCLLFTTGCPKKDAIRNAVEASYRLPALTNDVIAQVNDAYGKGYINLDTVHKFGDATNKLAKAELVFVGMVRAAHDIYVRTGQYPEADMLQLKIFFDAQIIAPFLDVLETVKLISPEASALILAAVSAVRLVLMTIGIGMGSKAAKALPKVAMNGAIAGGRGRLVMA